MLRTTLKGRGCPLCKMLCATSVPLSEKIANIRRRELMQKHMQAIENIWLFNGARGGNPSFIYQDDVHIFS